MTGREPESPPRFCPNCGTATVPGRTTCERCRHSLLPPPTQPADHDRLWGRDPNQARPGGSDVIDLYPDHDPMSLSSQATTPFTQTRPFEPVKGPEAGPAHDTAPANARRADPWASSSGTLSKATSSPAAPAGAAVSVSSSSGRERAGPPGLLLGCLAVLIIVGVAALLAWGAVHSAISDELANDLSVGITNELRSIDRVSQPSSGRVRITEDDLNEALRENASLYEPMKDVVAAIDSGAITIRFSLYGLESTYRTGLDVLEGRIVLVDSSLDGAAGRFVDEEAVGEVFEAEVAELMRRSNLRPAGVSLREGSVVIVTGPAA